MNYEARMFGRDDQLTLSGDETVQRRRWPWVVAILAILLVIVAGFMMMGRKGGDAAKAPASAAAGKTAKSNAQIPTVTVAVPGNSALSEQVSGTGSLAAKREMPVGVPGEGGLVNAVLVEPGQWVAAGQVLATIDRSVQVQTAESLAAQVRVARADAQLAQSNLERAQKLVSNGFVSKADIDQKTATRDSAMARVRVAEAQLAETRARNNRLYIRAPAAGLVLTRQVEPGQIVSSGSGVLFRLAKGGEMELRAQLAEADLQKVHVGSVATVRPVGSDAVFTGPVWQVAPVIDPTTRQGIARVQLAYNPALRPGGFASATISTGTQNVPLLPQSAVQTDEQNRNYVYIVNARNEAEQRFVTTGDVSDTGVAITKGLTGSEKVVLTAGAFLTPGQKVNPVLKKGQ
ncbi:efflux RND transporter periplasmic adaptor subunit [Sphingomonas sp.]|uniref:efflux RND transporter periplasmic adaptor subunit n=1 Tax=Sphingomonas sp. TaxID=28214 RepID=UPI001B240AD2|nr:efflux RND transporter periplasmic adaptor subunit [Sphingomonas sp.]MBO9714685.1 efflux RND transporter periplasmic adaptor subunit [Sphingomonas sp.]